MSQEQVTVAEEEYLQIIYWLQEAGLPITGANIARAMQVSAPTVHEMIGRLEADGYVTRASDKSLEFTETGKDQATQIVRRHRLIERFLTDVFDIPWDQVHEEAERLEHWMSPVVEERMLRAIGDAKTCPHGHPIFEGERETGVPLADVEEGAQVRVLRFENEAEDLLHYLKDTGLHPGLEGTLARVGDDEVVLEADGSSHSVTRSVAETVSVVADPSPPARTALPAAAADAASPLLRGRDALSDRRVQARRVASQSSAQSGRRWRSPGHPPRRPAGRSRGTSRRAPRTGAATLSATIVPASDQTARSVLSAIAVKGALRMSAGSATARFTTITSPKVRHQNPCTTSPERVSAAGPCAPSITTVCGTKNQRTARYTPGMIRARKPIAMPSAASSTAKKSGVKASKPDTSA